MKGYLFLSFARNLSNKYRKQLLDTGLDTLKRLPKSNFVDHKYKQKSEVLYSSTPNKSYDYLLNVESSNLVLL